MSKILFGVVDPLTRAGCGLEFGGFVFEFFRFFGETLGGEFCGTVPVFAQHAFGEVAEVGIGIFGSARFGGRWTSYLSASSFVVFLGGTIGFDISGSVGAARRAGS